MAALFYAALIIHAENTYASCYSSNRDTLPCFLVISDIHLHTSSNKTQHDLDSGTNTGDTLWDATKKKIRELYLVNHPKFIIVLGDLVMHEANKDSVDTLAKRVYSFLYDSLGKNISVIIAPGNNDSKDGDYKRLEPNHYKLFYPGQNHTACYVGNNDLNLGYYSVLPFGKKSKLRIIILNTSIFHVEKDTGYKYGCCQQQDAMDQLNWFFTQLQDAKKDSEHVIIAMHIPPGINEYGTYCNPKNPNDTPIFNWNLGDVQNIFLDSVYNYRDNILTLLSSHTHMDGIRLLYNDVNPLSSRIAALLISVPGIAPGHGNNPGIKIIQYQPYDKKDTNSYALQGFTTYYMSYWNNDTSGSIKQQWDSFNFRQQFKPALKGKNLLNDIKSITQPAALENAVDSIYTAKSKNKKTCITAIYKSIYITKIK